MDICKKPVYRARDCKCGGENDEDNEQLVDEIVSVARVCVQQMDINAGNLGLCPLNRNAVYLLALLMDVTRGKEIDTDIVRGFVHVELERLFDFAAAVKEYHDTMEGRNKATLQ